MSGPGDSGPLTPTRGGDGGMGAGTAAAGSGTAGGTNAGAGGNGGTYATAGSNGGAGSLAAGGLGGAAGPAINKHGHTITFVGGGTAPHVVGTIV